jgi:tau tubulin kinase
MEEQAFGSSNSRFKRKLLASSKDGGDGLGQSRGLHPLPAAASRQRAQDYDHDRHQYAENQSPLLTAGTKLKSRYVIVDQIGAGGFGQIFVAKDDRFCITVAVKAEATNAKYRFLRMEQEVLKKVQSSKHVAKFIASGSHPGCNYIIMSLLGKSVMELKRDTLKYCFSIQTAMRIALDMLQGIKDCHEAGYIHRDIKPSNFAIGKRGQSSCRRIYILDFGLCRQYRYADGRLRIPRERCGFRGTVRYASVNIHCGREMGRHDDLWSLFYVMVEMMKAHLPWRRISDRNKVRQLKESVSAEALTRSLPIEMITFVKSLKPLTYSSAPPYMEIEKSFQNVLDQLGVTAVTPYDWEAHRSADRFLQHSHHVTSTDRKIQLASGGATVPSVGQPGEDTGQNTWVDCERPA